MSVSVFGGFFRRLFEGREDHGGSLLVDFQALGEQGRVAARNGQDLRKQEKASTHSGTGFPFAIVL
jgi:hypothetical protein